MPNGKKTPVVIQFFDWFHEKSWIEDSFPDQLDWAAIGITGNDRSSKAFYKAQFDYIRSLGIDGIAWEYNLRADLTPTLPSPEALAALAESGLKICPFLDLEITFKVLNQSQETMNATLTVSQGIRPDEATVELVSSLLARFYTHVPQDLLMCDAKDRHMNFVFGYGFDRSFSEPRIWDEFAINLIREMCVFSTRPVFYWTFTNAPFLEHLLLHHRENFCAFHFVLDTPQAQFGHDAVTWNFGFDNLGVAQRDGLERVIRNDLRYYKEMGWLAAASDPSIIFIYSWNEAFEGSMLLPTEQWGDIKARLAKAFIARQRSGDTAPLPATLLIINDLNEAPEDWHTTIVREAIWYPLRRLAPQSDVRTVAEARDMDLSPYRYVIDFSVRKDEPLSRRLCDLGDETTLLFSHARSGLDESCLCDGFSDNSLVYKDFSQTLPIAGTDRTIFIRDDLVVYQPSSQCAVSAYVTHAHDTVPLIARVGNRIWLNALTSEDEALGIAFSVLYGRRLGHTILYGEGHESQRLLVKVPSGDVVQMNFHRKSVNLYWPLPKDLQLIQPPHGIDEAHMRFIHGLDAPEF
ncbi:hypothetical protein [Asticcacaulis sp. EMRT-3]|uniref:hypothetical protein n=1 Tax=Asticcacaulis sp. EMRT-3 TaxID=3040349 RepID=UPI0024AF5388|nr:hypothetical protein [Asticcacaulis sp. EMRT-3]MDI7776355.1 hypothetical protein [Asticcacaulis sp. EMRT-3]